MDPHVLIHALLSVSVAWGVLLCLVMSVLILASLRWKAELWLGDYPPDIRAAYGPIGRRARWQRWVVGIPVLVVPLVIAWLSLGTLAARLEAPLTVWLAAASVFLTLTLFNLFDLLVLDWLLFVTVQPRFIVLPGTEGLAGYKDYTFHFKAFLKGLAMTAVVAPALAWLYLLSTS